MSEKKFTMHIPKEIATALSRRHAGREDITREELLDAVARMNMLHVQYTKAKEKLEYCEGDWWDKMRVEQHFMQSRWYYAHAKRKKLLALVKELHKQMFYLMVTTDGNYEPFGTDAMYADDIAADFNSKYLKRLKTL